MNKEDAQAILKIIWMRDTLLDAGRCSDLRGDRLTGREHLLPQKGYSFQAPTGTAPRVCCLCQLLCNYYSCVHCYTFKKEACDRAGPRKEVEPSAAKKRGACCYLKNWTWNASLME